MPLDFAALLTLRVLEPACSRALTKVTLGSSPLSELLPCWESLSASDSIKTSSSPKTNLLPTMATKNPENKLVNALKMSSWYLVMHGSYMNETQEGRPSFQLLTTQLVLWTPNSSLTIRRAHDIAHRELFKVSITRILQLIFQCNKGSSRQNLSWPPQETPVRTTLRTKFQLL